MCTAQCDADEYMVDSAFVDGIWTHRVPCSVKAINVTEL